MHFHNYLARTRVLESLKSQVFNLNVLKSKIKFFINFISPIAFSIEPFVFLKNAFTAVTVVIFWVKDASTLI